MKGRIDEMASKYTIDKIFIDKENNQHTTTNLLSKSHMKIFKRDGIRRDENAYVSGILEIECNGLHPQLLAKIKCGQFPL